MKRPILIFALLLMSGPAPAAIDPVHNQIVAAKPASLPNVAALLGGKREKVELPLECSGYYLQPHKATGLSRCN